MAKFKGLVINKVLVDSSDTQQILVSEHHVFTTERVFEYKQMFNTISAKGILHDCKYEDSKWLARKNGFGLSCHLKFNFLLSENVNHALKAFVLLEFMEGLSVSRVGMSLTHVKRVLELLYPFSEKSLEKFKGTFYGITQVHTPYEIATICKRFFSFYKVPISDSLIEFFGQIQRKPSKIRKLPDYQSILLFDEKLKEFFHDPSTPFEMKIKYSIIQIWWKLTTIIPLRPNEFLRLRRDCFTTENDVHWIVVPRSKQKKYRNADIEIVNRFQITESFFNLLKEHCEITNEYNDCRYLFPYRLFQRFLKDPSHSWKLKKNKELMGVQELKGLFNAFYDEVIQEKYNLKHIKKEGLCATNQHGVIERLSPMDTRHLAICNAMIQNVSPLTIAHLAGHTRIEAQLHYCKHLETFLQSAVYNLAERLLKERQINTPFSDIEFSSLIDKSKLAKYTDFFQKYPEIESGICTDPEFPNRCMGDCEFCDHYILNLNKHPNAIEKLNHLSSGLGIDIQKYLGLLLDIRYKMSFNDEKVQNFGANVEQLDMASQALKRAINQKATIDSYLLED